MEETLSWEGEQAALIVCYTILYHRQSAYINVASNVVTPRRVSENRKLTLKFKAPRASTLLPCGVRRLVINVKQSIHLHLFTELYVR